MDDKAIFDKFRDMAGGSLTQDQVNGLNAVIAAGQRDNIIKAFGLATNDVTMSTSIRGMMLIAGFEGYRDKAYQDQKGVWTIGFGTTVYPNGKRVKAGDTCTKDQALLWKKHDIANFEKLINEIITVPLNQNQFDAIVSLVYNIGFTAFKNGSIDDHINARRTDAALATWAKYNKVRSPKTGQLEFNKGLDNRRKAEIAYFKA